MLPSAAGAHNVNNAVDDLRTHDVTFEQGALTNKDIDELDALTSRRQGDGYVKVVVLAWAVSDFSTTRRFAEGVRSR